MPTPEEIAYSAGLFDGEGSVYYTLDHRTANCYGATSVVQTKREVLDWLTAIWGFGKVYTSKIKSGHLYQWRIDGENAISFLTSIRPYLRVRGPRVDEWLSIKATQIGRNSRRGPDGRALGYNADERGALLAAVTDFRNRTGRRRPVSVA